MGRVCPRQSHRARPLNSIVRSQMNYRAAISIAAMSLAMLSGAGEARELVRVPTPESEALFVDFTSIQRQQEVVSFTYVLGPSFTGELRSAPAGWNATQVSAIVDCAKRTITTGLVTAYSGIDGSTNSPGGVVPYSPGRVVERIAPRTTFAHLADFVCGRT